MFGQSLGILGKRLGQCRSHNFKPLSLTQANINNFLHVLLINIIQRGFGFQLTSELISWDKVNIPEPVSSGNGTVPPTKQCNEDLEKGAGQKGAPGCILSTLSFVVPSTDKRTASETCDLSKWIESLKGNVKGRLH